MPPKVFNKETYYALKARIHFFNQRYSQKLKYMYDTTVTEELFSSLSDTWADIAAYQTDDFSKTDLPLDLWITDENFKRLKDAVATIRFHFAGVARDKELGEKYFEPNGEQATDYTNVSREIFEICMLALHTYTNFFNHCDHWIRLRQFNSNDAEKRAKELAEEMHLSKDLHTFELDYESKQWIDNPFNNIHLDIAKKVFNKDNYTDPQWDKEKDRAPYIEVKKAKDREEEIRIARVNEEIERKRLEKIQREKQSQINSENARIIYEKRLNPQIGDYSVYDTFRDAIKAVPNENPPRESYEHFYAFFKKLGIDENDLTAQTLIDAMNEVHKDTKDNPDNLEFCLQVEPIYRQLQAHAFEAAIKRGIQDREVIDLNSVSRKVDETMAALYCTVNLEGFQNPNDTVRARAAEIINGVYMNVAKPNVSEWLRAASIDNVKKYYTEKGVNSLTQKVDDIYNSYAESSSGQIATNARNYAKEYVRYRAAVQRGICLDDEFAQGFTKCMYMEHAYALERRVETRYATRFSKIIRFVSYLRQKSALSEMKKSLGIAPERRVADTYLDTRLSAFAKDSSDPKYVSANRIVYTMEPKSMVIEHVRATLKISIPGKNLPEAIIKEEPVIKEELDPNTIIGQALQEEENRKQEELQKQIEEQARIEKEKEEEQNRIREAELRKQAILDEKEKDYQEKLDAARKRVDDLGKIRDDIQNKEDERIAKIDKEIASIPGQISKLENEKIDIEQRIQILNIRVESMTKMMSQKANDATAEAKIKENKGVSGFFRGVFGVDKREQAKAQKKVNQSVSNNEIFSDMTQTMLSKLLVDIENEKTNLENNKKQIDELYRKERSLKESKETSALLKGAVSDHVEAKKNLQYLIENKDKFVCVSEKLSFEEALLNADEGIDELNDPLRSSNQRDSYVSNDGRFTVIVDDVNSENDAQVSLPVDENKKDEQLKISKK